MSNIPKFEIIKTKVNAPTRKLNASWTVEPLILKPWTKLSALHCGKNVYAIRDREIQNWIESYPKDKWTYVDYDFVNHSAGYTFTEDLESWFLLRWS
jgi:hypothetical protein